MKDRPLSPADNMKDHSPSPAGSMKGHPPMPAGGMDGRSLSPAGGMDGRLLSPAGGMDGRPLSPADKWILAGIPAAFALGTLFHFLYDLLGGNPAAGILAPVNESVWEHGKLVLWPGALWWLLGWGLGKTSSREEGARRWFSGALAGLLAGVAAVSLLYYFYTQAFGLERLWVDVLLLLAADALAQGLGLHLWRRGKPWPGGRLLLLYLLLFLLFLYLTYFPPHIPWFQDGPTGGYGPL